MKRVAHTLFASVLVWVVFLPTASAQGLGGFVFTEFTSDIEIRKDGVLEITEEISGEFLEQRHGLFRQIPVDYVLGEGFTQSIKLDVAEVQLNDGPVPYEVYKESGYKVIKIGDPDKTIIGPFTYTIRYSVERGIWFGDTHDELYWNVTGNDWAETIPSASATVRVPETVADEMAVWCYTGYYGSTEGDCTTDVRDGEVEIHASDFLTIAVGFPKGVVPEPTQFDRVVRFLEDNWDVPFILFPILLGVYLFVHWWRYGKDPKGRGTIIAQYEPPDGLRPTEVGTLVDAKLHAKDFSAAIVDLAVRGYLKIHEEEKKTLGISSSKYRFEKVRDTDEQLKPYEKKILNAIFPSGKNESTLSSQNTKLASARTSVRKTVYKAMAKDGYYVKNPSTARWTYFGAAIGVAVLGHFAGTFAAAQTDRPIVLVVGYACAAIIAIYAPFMPKKTRKGVNAYEHAQGFREYLRTAEKYRVEWQEKQGIFEQFLPYAMVYGVADKWAKVFEGVQTTSPTWYSTYRMATFNPTDFSKNVSSFVTAGARVSAPSSSGGSSGGGFSGGGFGGGGGGSW